MKILLKNNNKSTLEFIECQHIKIDEERLLLAGARTISILIKDMELMPTNFIEEIGEAFLKNKNIILSIEEKKLILN